MKKCEIVNHIYYENIKKGDIVKFKGHDKFYVVIQHSQTYHLIPININGPDVIRVNIFDIFKPEIEAIFDGKNGNAKFMLNSEEVKENE